MLLWIGCAGVFGFAQQPAADGAGNPPVKPSPREVLELVEGPVPSAAPGVVMPALDSPRFSASLMGYGDAEPMLLVRGTARTRLYPLRILQYHPVVNDVLGQQRILVTFSPLAGTIGVYDARIDGMDDHLEFETTGVVMAGSDILWDRRTGSLWLQASGRAIAGPLAGAQLTRIVGKRMGFSDALTMNRTGPLTILSGQTGYSRPYGQPAYPGYDELARPGLLWPPVQEGLLSQENPMEMVTRLGMGDTVHILSHRQIAGWGARNLWLEEGEEMRPVVAWWNPGVESVYSFRDIPRTTGVLMVFHRQIKGFGSLTFEETGDPRLPLRDLQTGSKWNQFGRAVEGELAGRTLEEIPGLECFRFAWELLAPVM